MLQKIIFFITIGFCAGSFAQSNNLLWTSKKIAVSNDTIFIEKTSIDSHFFKLVDANNNVIDSLNYQINFEKGFLLMDKNRLKTIDSVTVHYKKFPEFLTKQYSIYDSKRLVSNSNGAIFKTEIEDSKKFVPFDGLTTSGSITRGITIGNNQNSVVNSNLDLQLTGKLSDKLSIKASIQDSNLPLRNGGYSQKLEQFDQIFIELFSDKWNLRAGDLFLENRKSKFLNFNKKVQGLAANVKFGEQNKNTVFASAAIVKGQYAKSEFVGQEGNQGPYKLRGQNGELYILVVAETENVFVNGILLKRGEDQDYVIDYNSGEIKFTSKFTITSEMRIAIEYQYTDRNYSRFVSYAGAHFEQKEWTLGGYLYSENDLKDQTLQQDLTENQVEILKNAGDNTSLMNADSAYLDSYSTNKILYKKTSVGTTNYYEYSNNATDVLYNVKFTFVGNNAGNYILSSNNAIGKIYQYVASISGVLQGNYEPIIKLVAPSKIQIATVLGTFNPTKKTNLDFEIGISNNDKNLFSSLDDSNNQGLAAKLNFKQRLFTKKWNFDVFGKYQLVQQNFATVERLFTIEFNRDWNLTTFSGNQSYLVSGFNIELPQKSKWTYQIENLNFSDSFAGNKHLIDGIFNAKNVVFQNKSSYLTSDGNYSKTRFVRNQSQLKFHFKKNWLGSSFRLEDNNEKLKSTQVLSNLSQRFAEYGAFLGRGDSTKVFAELGFLIRKNDSLQNNFVRPVNQSNSFYLKSQLLKSEKRNLSLFVNYRTLLFENKNVDKQNSLNIKSQYNDRFFNDIIQTSNTFETNSGTIAQQEFTYLEVAPTLGVYMWNDYNNNNIQELQEFEVAVFADQAKYVRVFLPNQVFVKTHINKFFNSITINPNNWQNESGFKKTASYFYNQTSFLIERKIARKTDNFDLNPFSNSDDLLGLNSSFKNSFFYNRGKQNHSATYTFSDNKSKNLLSIGAIENNSNFHQVHYSHLIEKTWLFDFDSKTIQSSSTSENYASRNFKINAYLLAPKISYLLNDKTSFDVFYEYQDKKNSINEMETLQQTKFGTSFSYINDKNFTSSGEFLLTENNFIGNELSPVAFQMLEGLQAGKNLTWRLLLQKSLTKYLNLSINYQGRKSETNQAIHTGNVQLKAFF